VVASAVGTLAGPLHGGANEDVLAMLEEIGSPANAAAYLDEAMASKRKVMGFGHREYRVKDPRAVILQSLAEEMFARFGHDALYDVARALEEAADSRLGPKGIYPNVDFYSGLVYRKLGIPRDLFTPVFAIARVAGWLAHWREQLGANRIFRPSQIYTGHPLRSWITRESRVPAAGA
jgi:citrate synthase